MGEDQIKVQRALNAIDELDDALISEKNYAK